MKTLRLRNFRCLQDTGDIEIRPLTFLVGANSSGKSSFLKFFPLLKQSSRVRKRGVFLWNYHDVDMRDFKNTVREGTDNIGVEFIIGTLPLRGYTNRVRERTVDNVRVNLEITGSDEHNDYLSNMVIVYANQIIKIVFEKNGKAVVYVNNVRMSDLYPSEDVLVMTPAIGLMPSIWYETERDINDLSTSNFSTMRKLIQDHFSSSQMAAARLRSALNLMLFSKEELIAYVKNEWDLDLKKRDMDELNNMMIYQNVSYIIQSINDYITGYANSIEYVRPLRATVERYYRFQNYAIDEIDSNGENLAMYLYNLNPRIKRNLDWWTSEMFGFVIQVNPHEGHVELGVSEKDSRTFHNLVDVGFGYTQLLPIIVLIWKAVYTGPSRVIGSRKNSKKVIVIEQPELHLHPRMQMLFADMLAKILQTTGKGKFKFVIETHSETIINRIGELVSQGGLFSNEDVNVVLFNKDDNGSSVSVSNYDEDGYLTNWPVGFFSGYAD